MKSVTTADDGLRLDRWFRTHYPSLRHGALEKLLRTGQIRVNGGRVKASHRLAAGDDVRVPPLPDGPNDKAPGPEKRVDPGRAKADAEFIRSLAIHEDDALLVLNKPYGLAVQGGVGTKRHVDGMLGGLLNAAGERPRLVHRLDRDTSGVLVLARTRKAAAALSEALRRRQIEKTYWALTVGAPRPREGTINLAIGKTPRRVGDEDQERMAPDEDDGKRAITDYMTIENAGTVTFLALKPVTGRTHQLRVHCAAIETPIVGDFKYGGPAARVEGVSESLHLFCRSMRFAHPTTGRPFTATAPLSGHMKESWRFFGFPQPSSIEWPDVKPRKR